MVFPKAHLVIMNICATCLSTCFPFPVNAALEPLISKLHDTIVKYMFPCVCAFVCITVSLLNEYIQSFL